MTNMKRRAVAASSVLGTMLVAVLLTAGMAHAQVAEHGSSLELIPSAGMTKSTDTNAGDAKAFGGLALRASLAPFLKLEGGIGYRQDTYLDGALKVHQWPVTASLWLVPAPIVYLGGGVGWYRTSLDFTSELVSTNSTSDKLGVHAGGGFLVPLAPRLHLDLNGRYIFMTKDKASFDVPSTFNPDFWTVSAGLAISL